MQKEENHLEKCDQSAKTHDRLVKFLKAIDSVKQAEKSNTYIALSDVTPPAQKDEDIDFGPMFAIAKHSTEEYLVLLQRAQNILKEYMNMKDFILDIFVGFALGGMSTRSGKMVSADAKAQAANIIKAEMDDNFKALSAMASTLSSKKTNDLNKSVTYNELYNLVGDLECRMQHYRPYYHSYVVDTHYAH